MPSRLIRNELLDSQRYWSVSIEARQLFVHLMLLADDFGLVSLAAVFLRRRCFDNPPPDAKIGKQVGELHDEGLLRVYEVNGARYGFIPRFGQRMRQARARHPMPPGELFSDDLEAQKLFMENKPLFEKLSAVRGQAGSKVRPEVEGKRKEKEVEVKTGKSAEQWAKDLGIQRFHGEHEGAFQVRVAEAVGAHKTKVPS